MNYPTAIVIAAAMIVVAIVFTNPSEGASEKSETALVSVIRDVAWHAHGDRIVLRPGPARGELHVEIQGQAGAVLAFAFQDGPPPGVMLEVVAEEGLEPPTRGL